MPSLNEFLKQFITENRCNLIAQKLQYRTRYLTLVVENVYQSHNASAILRSCDCFGIQDVHIIEKNNAFTINEEIALGAQQWLSIYKYNSFPNNTIAALNNLRLRGYRIVATTLNDNAVALEKFDLSKGKTAIVVGTELTGISDDVMKLSDEFLMIPMRGFTQSLNVSVATGIILHFFSWRLFNSQLPWQLSLNESTEIELEWLKKTIKNSEALINKYYGVS